MADISKELKAWKDARLGKDVRQAQIDLSTKINAEVEKNTSEVAQEIEKMNTAVSRADTAARNAETKAVAANTAAAAANAAAAKAENYVLGDISEKTVTYSEPAQAGENAPASGAKLSAVVGWMVKRFKEIGESMAGLNSNTYQLSKVNSIQNVNINDASFWQPGIWTCNSTANAATIQNIPVASAGFKLITEHIGSTTNKMQTIKYNTGEIYNRTINSSGAIISWKEVTNNEVNSKMVYSTGTGTKAATISSNSLELVWYKYGRICVIRFAFIPSSDISANKALIASGFPAAAGAQTESVPVVNSSGSISRGNIGITTDGCLYNWYASTLKTGEYVKGGIVYITKD